MYRASQFLFCTGTGRSSAAVLKEANIQLTEEQAENIKKVQEQNGLYEAQKLLLQEVNNTYGGIAESLANTDTGKLEQLQDAWQDLKEGLGETLMNSLDGVLDYTLSLVEKIEGFVMSTIKKIRVQFAYKNEILTSFSTLHWNLILSIVKP